jgi:hypothetical protein
LQTVYSLADLYDLIEVTAITAENERRAMKAAEKRG